jgi:hypothetical protein
MKTDRSQRRTEQRERVAAASLAEAAARLVDDAVRQGFPRVTSDPSVMAKIAGILRVPR